MGVISEGLVLESAVNEFFFAEGMSEITEAGGNIAIVFPDDGSGGAVTLTWGGMDEAGNPLANGSYIVKVESVDSLGISTVITGTATILRMEATATLRIYNEAGELVWTSRVSGLALDQSEVEVQGSVVDPSLPAGSPGSTLNVELGTLNVVWSGVDQQGHSLANGEYLLEITLESGGESSVITETVTVLSQSQMANGKLQMSPNPAAGNGPVALRVAAGSLGGTARVYTVSGELLRRLDFSGDNASWDLRDTRGSLVSAGLYLILVESQGAKGLIENTLGRLVILR